VLTVEGNSLISEVVSGTTVNINQGGQILNGVLQTHYTIQRKYQDHSGTGAVALYAGMMIDSMTLSATTEAVVTGSFSWLGKKELSASSITGTFADPNTEDVMNSVEDVAGVQEGRLGTATAYDAQTITAFSFSLGNINRYWYLQCIGYIPTILRRCFYD